MQSVEKKLPAWFIALQDNAKALVETLPLPKADKTNIKTWEFDVIDDVQHQNIEGNKIPSAVSHLVSVDEQNVMVICDGMIVYKNLSDDYQDLVIANLEEALTTHEETFRPYFMSILKQDESKCSALHLAHLNSGLFIYVPKNKVLNDVLNVIYLQKEGSFFNHTLMIVDQNAQFKYIENYHNCSTANVNIVSEVIVKENAHVEYAAMDRLCEQSLSYMTRRAQVSDYGRFYLSYGGLNDGCTVAENFVSLMGQGAFAEVKTVAIAERVQKQNITVKIEHLAPYTEGYIVNHGVGKDEGQLTFNGIGKIHKGMSGSIAKQESRAMILSENARTDANPILLIDEYDVQAGHAAGLGKIDEEQLYYLMSRGLTRRDAEILIIYGFLMPFINDIRSESIKNEFTKVIEQKINA